MTVTTADRPALPADVLALALQLDSATPLQRERLADTVTPDVFTRAREVVRCWHGTCLHLH